MVETSGQIYDTNRSTSQNENTQYSHRLETLLETALLINQAGSEEQIYPLLLEQLRSIIRFDSACVLLVESACLRIVASAGFPPETVPDKIPIPVTAQTPSLLVVDERQPILVDNMPESYPGFAENCPETARKIVSWMGVPLTWQDQTVGEIALDRWQLEPFEQDDLRLTTIIANHAAGAVVRIRLHDQVRESNEQLEQRVAQRTAEIAQAQTAIRNLVERLELATRTAGIGVWEWDLINHTLFLDENTRRLLELPPDLDPGQMFADWPTYVYPDDVQKLQDNTQAVLDQNLVIDTSCRVRTPDGGYRHLHIRAMAFRGEDGKPQRVIGVSADITKAREAEEQRIRTQENLRKSEEHLRLINAELERTGRLKDEFLANMSHELRTPLNAILILSESLQEGVYGPVNDQQQQALTDVVDCGQHLLALINDILDLSKIEAGKLELQYGAASVTGVCQSSLRMVRELATKKRQAIILELPADHTLVWADERRLRQMLVNLLTNAVKFTPEEGRIGLEVTVSSANDQVSFAVWDTGIGIAKHRLPHLFQPFAQLDSALNRQFSGTGLGLALVRRLAEMHGGSVEVQSELEAGTRFTIVLPNQSSALEYEADAGNQGELR